MTAAPRTNRRPSDEQDEDHREGRMGFLDHLDELRSRIIRSFIAIAACTLVASFFVDRIGNFVLAPTLKSLGPDGALIYTRPGEGFSFYFDVALIAGVILAAPFVMYQVWRFVAPALYRDEKRFVVPFLLLATTGTLGGALFAHYVLFPGMIAFFARFNTRAMRFVPRVEDTFDLYKSMMIGMVIVFQMPTLVFFLARLRMVTARFLWRNIKYAVLIIFIVAAVLTSSPDAWNQIAFAAPMVALYVLSIGIAWVVAPKQGKDMSDDTTATKLRLVVAATMIDQARRRPG